MEFVHSFMKRCWKNFMDNVHSTLDIVHGFHGHCPHTPWIPWTLSTHSVDSMDIFHTFHGHCPQIPWTLSTHSMDSMDIVHTFHGFHGHCPHIPWISWRMSMDSLSMDSMENIHGFHGKCPGCPWNPWTVYRRGGRLQVPACRSIVVCEMLQPVPAYCQFPYATRVSQDQMIFFILSSVMQLCNKYFNTNILKLNCRMSESSISPWPKISC